MIIYLVIWDHDRRVRAFSTNKLRNEYISEFLLGKPVRTMETVLVEETQ